MEISDNLHPGRAPATAGAGGGRRTPAEATGRAAGRSAGRAAGLAACVAVAGLAGCTPGGGGAAVDAGAPAAPEAVSKSAGEGAIAAVVHGRVLHADERPVAGVEVRVAGTLTRGGRGGLFCQGRPGPETRATTDADGRYSTTLRALAAAGEELCVAVAAHGVRVAGSERHVVPVAGIHLAPGGEGAGAGEAERVEADLVVTHLPPLPEAAGGWGPDRNAMHAGFARSVLPGFAGVWFEGCALVVGLTDPRLERAARARFEPFLRQHPGSRACGSGASGFRIAVRQMRYDFAQLADWYAALWRADPGPAVLMSGITESANRIEVTVRDTAAAARVRAAATRAGIPADAVRVLSEFAH
jgi:hypothetical protein